MSSTPVTYLISIAINNYSNLQPLKYAVEDSNALCAILTDKYRVELHEEKLHDSKASILSISRSIQRLKEKCRPDDSLLILFNGHGKILNETTYFLLHNARNDDNHNEWLSWHNLHSELKALDLKHIAVFLNSCFSGNVFLEAFTNNLNEGNGKSRHLFTATLDDQLAADNYQNLNNSPFASSVIEILKKNNEKPLSIREIITYTIADFNAKEYPSTPRDGRFSGDGGGEFYINLKEDEHILWKNACQENDEISYEKYERIYPKGTYLVEARDKREKILASKKDWIDCNQKIISLLKSFICRHVESSFLKIAETSLKKLNNELEELTRQEKIDSAWKTAKEANTKAHYQKFISEHDGSEYINEANEIIEYIERKQNESEAWTKIDGQLKRINPHRDVALKKLSKECAEYICDYRHSERYEDAVMYRNQVASWLEVISEENLKRKEDLLKRHETTFPLGIFYDAIEKVRKNTIYQKQEPNFIEAVDQALRDQSCVAISQIVNDIKGLGDNELNYGGVRQILEQSEAFLGEYRRKVEESYEEVIKTDKGYSYHEFLNNYGDTNSIPEVLDVLKLVQDSFFKKENELFQYAEESKQIIDYDTYLSEFDGCNNPKPIYLGDAKEHRSQIAEFQTLNSKLDFATYIDRYPKGVMLKEAEDRLRLLNEIDEEKRRFREVMEKDSIELCDNYLGEYYKEAYPENVKAVEDRKIKLDYIKRSKILFEEIEDQADNLKKIDLCDTYVKRFQDGQHIDYVKSIEKSTQELLAKYRQFNEAKDAGDIEALKNYISQHPDMPNLPDALDWIDFLSAKEAESKEDIEVYLKRPNAINKELASDCLRFFEAKRQNSIEAFDSYLIQQEKGIYHDDAKQLKHDLVQKEEERVAFAEIENGNATIEACEKYLRGQYPRPEEHEAHAKNLIKHLREANEEERMFFRGKDEDDFIQYINRYKSKGKHYKEAVEKLKNLTNPNIAEPNDDDNALIKEVAKCVEAVSQNHVRFAEMMNKKLNNTVFVLVFVMMIFVVTMIFLLFSR